MRQRQVQVERQQAAALHRSEKRILQLERDSAIITAQRQERERIQFERLMDQEFERQRQQRWNS